MKLSEQERLLRHHRRICSLAVHILVTDCFMSLKIVFLPKSCLYMEARVREVQEAAPATGSPHGSLKL